MQKQSKGQECMAMAKALETMATQKIEIDHLRAIQTELEERLKAQHKKAAARALEVDQLKAALSEKDAQIMELAAPRAGSSKDSAAAKVSKAAKGKCAKGSNIAKGRFAKYHVYQGNLEKLASGRTKSDLIKTKRGRIVTKQAFSRGKKAYKHIKAWNKAVMQAREALGITGYCLIGGPTAQGQALLAKTRSLYSNA